MNIVKQAMEGCFEDKGPILSMEEIAVVDQEIEAVAAMGEADREICSIDSEITQAEQIVTGLEDLAFVADTIEKPTQREAALIQIASDIALAGTENTDELLPSMEDISDGKSFAAKIKTLIEQIKKAIIEYSKKLWNWLGSLIANGEKISIAREQKASTFVKQIKDSKSLEKTFSGSALVDKNMNGSEFISRVKRMRESVREAFSAIHKFAENEEKAKEFIARHMIGLSVDKDTSIPEIEGGIILPESTLEEEIRTDDYLIRRYSKEIPYSGYIFNFSKYKLFAAKVNLKTVGDYSVKMMELTSAATINGFEKVSQDTDKTFTVTFSNKEQVENAAELLKEISLDLTKTMDLGDKAEIEISSTMKTLDASFEEVSKEKDSNENTREVYSTLNKLRSSLTATMSRVAKAKAVIVRFDNQIGNEIIRNLRQMA